MGEDTRTGGAVAAADPAELRHEIENTRRELGDTVAALAEKADVKRQARRAAQRTRASIGTRADELAARAKRTSPRSVATLASTCSTQARANPVLLAAAGAFAAGLLVGAIARGGR